MREKLFHSLPLFLYRGHANRARIVCTVHVCAIQPRWPLPLLMTTKLASGSTRRLRMGTS